MGKIILNTDKFITLKQKNMKTKDYWYFAFLITIVILVAINIYYNIKANQHLDVLELNLRALYETN